MNSLYLDDYSNEETIDNNIIKNDLSNDLSNNLSNDLSNNLTNNIVENKPSFKIKPDFNSKGEKIVVFSIIIPFKNENDSLTIDILINNDMYKNIGKYLG